RQKQRRILLPSLPCSSAALHGRRSPPAMALVTLQRSPTPSAASSASSSAGEDFGSDDDRKNNQRDKAFLYPTNVTEVKACSVARRELIVESRATKRRQQQGHGRSVKA
ncbi:hypothetical protein ILYODFUR_022234, partial [Ilyodon furcidens]